MATFADLDWTDCEPCEYRFRSDAQRIAAARLVLTFYGDRACAEDPTSPDGRYRPHTDMPRRAINSWECAMSAAKYDRHRTADERAACLANLATFDHYFSDWQQPDAPLGFILGLEGFGT